MHWVMNQEIIAIAACYWIMNQAIDDAECGIFAIAACSCTITEPLAYACCQRCADK